MAAAAGIARARDPFSLVKGRTVTGFANVGEDYGNAAAGVEIMTWRLEDVLRERCANDIQAAAKLRGNPLSGRVRP